MSTTKYEHIRIPVLKKSDYSTWKVKMLIFLEATDPDYIDRINDGPHEPRKLVPAAVVDGITVPEHYVAKDKFEWTSEEKIDVLKDAKVKNILHNSLDEVLSNRVITCKTAKEILDALEVQCQGTKAIKKNRRALLIQEYEQFEAKADESLTEVYDRFLSLLNELSMIGKVYDYEDSNTKFLRALSEDWDTQTSIIRHQYDLNEIYLDEIYGMLKIHDMELQQRKNRKSNRNKGVALKIDSRSSGSMKGKGRTAYPDESSNTDDDSESNTDDSNTDESLSDEDIKEMMAMLVKGFKRMKYRKQKRQFNSSKKFGKYGEKKEKDSKTGKLDKSKVRCYNCDGMGHFATECKKAKKTQGKALITGNKDWMDSDSEDEEVSYALMANADETKASTSDKVHTTNYNCDLNSVSEMRCFLNSLHTSFRSQSLENSRFISEANELNKRNDHLEAELIFLLEIQKECDKAKHNEQLMIQKCTYLQGQLDKERETLKIWTDSGKKTQEILGGGNWKTGLGYVDKKEASKTIEEKKENIYTKPVKFKKATSDKSTLKEKSFPTSGNHVNPDASANPDTDANPDKNEQTKNKLSKKNVGLLSKIQLNKKISNITGKSEKKGPKRNRNGKQGIDKANGYKMNPDAPRKCCFKCGNTNHLSLDCRKIIRKKTEIPLSDKSSRSVRFKPENPCSHCGSKWHSIYVCTAYHSLYHNNYEPLPKFYKGTNYVKKKISSQVYRQVNPSAKSNSDGINPDSVKTDGTNPDEVDLKSKTSAASKINIKHVKRVQQVWILKNSN